MMPAPSITSRVVAALNQAGLPHMLVGAFARNYYAEPRSTKDADLVLGVGVGSLRAVMDALGPEFRLEEQMAFETNTGTLKNVIHHPNSGFTVELFYLSQDAHDQERFKRRRPTTYEGQPTFVLTAEDYIVTKLRWPRPKDFADARDVIAMQGDELDWAYIHHWTDLHGSRDKLASARASIPPKPNRPAQS
jgi:hypothetical protein